MTMPALLLAALTVQAIQAPPADPRSDVPAHERPSERGDVTTDLPPETAPDLEPSPGPAALPSGRSEENAVREAEDAFGYSVRREILGIYSASNVRGFSPFAAGNVRIEGLYFDPYLSLLPRLRRSTSIRVGLSAQGYPFLSPTGIVDYAFRKPTDEASLSALLSADSYEAASLEVDAVAPLTDTLSLGIGGQIGRTGPVVDVSGFTNQQAVSLRWRPSPGIEIIPFWQRSEVRDAEALPIYIPADAALPPRIARRSYDGPEWTDYDSVAGLQGVLATISPAQGWTVRGGLFRSLYDDRSAFSHLLTGLTQDGAANRLIIADPRTRFISLSGELRVSRAFTEGPRLHSVHLSYRGRDRRQRYAGSDVVNFGPTRIGERFEPPEPEFAFNERTRDVVQQSLYGLAYEGRWRGVGELSFAVSHTDYTKRFELPGAPVVETRADPLVYNVSAAAEIGPRLVIYAGYARGLEESGIAPDQAINRNQPLPAILTRQIDGGARYRPTDGLNLSAGVFELRKPYFALDAANRFGPLGETRNRGMEFSLAGTLTPTLNLVAGAVLLDPRVLDTDDSRLAIGERPVGLPSRSADLNLDWRTPLDGVSLDIGVSHSGAVPARVDNAVFIPERTLFNIGARYRFRRAGRAATLRVQLFNVGNTYGFDLRGAGGYVPIPGRVLSAYMTMDF